MAVELGRHLLVGLALQVGRQHPALEIAQVLPDALPHREGGFLADDELFGVGDLDAADHVEEGPVGVLIVDRLVERDVRVERDVLLPRRGLDRGDDLAGDAQLGERPERRQLLPPEVPNGLVEADHPLLDDILAIGPDQKVRLGFDSDEVAVLVDQILGGELIASLCAIDKLFIHHFLVDRYDGLARNYHAFRLRYGRSAPACDA